MGIALCNGGNQATLDPKGASHYHPVGQHQLEIRNPHTFGPQAGQD
jgi:hypothetical protein